MEKLKMKKYIIYLSFSISIIFYTINLWSQSSETLKTNINLILANIKYIPSDSERIESGKNVQMMLDSLLRFPENFGDELKNIKYLGKIISPDKKLALITYNIPLTSGTHRFFGIIQMAPENKQCKTFLLHDISEQYTQRPVFEQFTPQKWYGALYYQIIPQKTADGKVYILLGSCLNNSLMTNKKIIESLWFDENGMPIFGKPVFDYGLKVQSRIIFEFNIQARMTIQYHNKLKMIIFDHLAPSSPIFTNNFEYYGPDASFDGLKYENGLWRYWPKVNPY